MQANGGQLKAKAHADPVRKLTIIFSKGGNNDKEYKVIPGYSNYECSEDGDIYSRISKKHLIPCVDKDGYYKVGLVNGEKVDTWFVHRIVAVTWVQNPDGRNVVNHIDSNRTNNNYHNLEWITPKGNVHHGIQFGNIQVHGESNPNSNLNYDQVSEIRNLYKNGLRISEIQKQFDFVTWTEIKNIALNKNWNN